jgi:hypothetical protein
MKKIVTLVGIAIFLSLNASVVSACMCMRFPSTPKDGLADAGAVFQGKVVAVKKGEWAIAVERVWKGEVEEKVLMRARSVGTSCSPEFNLGESYIFFADVGQTRRRTVYHPRGCTWTTSLTFRHEGVVVSEAIAQELGESTPPAKKLPKEKRRQ